MSLTINAKAYTANGGSNQRVGYVGPSKTLQVKDDVVLAYTPARPTSVFSGLARTQAKLTRTLTLTGALTTTGDIIVTIDIAAPVGSAGADIDTALNDLGAFLSSATAKTLAKTQLITY